MKKESNKIQVTFNETQLKLIDEFKGIFGDTRAEIVRNITTNWIFEKYRLKKKDEK
jgi:hypothetical protein